MSNIEIKPCCDSCQSECSELKEYPRYKEEPMNLCHLCSHTMLSSFFQYRNQFSNGESHIGGALAYIGNLLLSEIAELRREVIDIKRGGGK